MVPKEIEIKANNIDAAAGEILGILEGTSKHERNIYFDGWEGLGASAALKVVAQRLKSSAAQKMKFDKVVHVDCSLWKSMRALQKAVAEELELPQSVMAIFDQHDEEDDFNGIDQASRGVISDVTEEIFRKLFNSRFMVIFHNRSSGYIDLYECGVPVTSFLSNQVLWTWSGRFRFYPKIEDKEMEKFDRQTDVFMEANLRDGEWRDVLHEEAEEVAKYMGILEPDMKHTVVECFLYAWARRRAGGINWETHASNYWVCDGIIKGQGDTAWEVGDALRRNIHLHWILDTIPSWVQQKIDDAADIFRPNGRWVSATHQAGLHDDDICVLPPQATSFLLLADKPDGGRMILPAVMFPHSDDNRLRVLHLSWCTFSFTSPPFLCCSHLRFLLLDHCTDVREEKHQSHSQDRSCFQKLWVLDLRSTDWHQLLSEKMMCLMAELRELNVERVKDWSIGDLCGGGTSLVKLLVTADPVPATAEIIMHKPVPNLSSASHLNTIILDNCVGLERVVPDVLPPSLESFSFINNAAATANISSISFRGLAKLKSVLLRGLMQSLQELDLSGTAVKTLDLREVVALNLKRLILLGCEKLRAIQWPPHDKRPRRRNEQRRRKRPEKTPPILEIEGQPQDKIPRSLEVLHVDTIRSASSGQAKWEEKTKEVSPTTGSSSVAATKPPVASLDFNRYISVRDARLLRSLVPLQKYFDRDYVIMEMDSSPASSVAVGDSEGAQGIRQPDHYLYASDITLQDHLQAAANEGAIRWMWACPPIPAIDKRLDWYVHIQDEEEMKSGLLQQQGSTSTQGTSTGAALNPGFIWEEAKTLHVHDSLSITTIPFPQGSFQNRLQWCRVERCPKLRSAFATPQESEDKKDLFWFLTTFWASQLPTAHYIWNWSTTSQPGGRSFEDLEFLHLDYCPRLKHVLPLSADMDTLPQLETLEIVCCGDLSEVFPLDPERQQKQTIVEFPRLRRIHLHDLPTLQRICGSKMLAPKLETVKIRGCWSLRRLPAVDGNTERPKVDCEKEWWDSLDRDIREANQYEKSHSPYYKKAQLPRGTLLR